MSCVISIETESSSLRELCAEQIKHILEIVMWNLNEMQYDIKVNFIYHIYLHYLFVCVRFHKVYAPYFLSISIAFASQISAKLLAFSILS